METKQIRVIVGKGKEKRVLIIDWDLYGAAEAAMGIGYGDRWIGREISQLDLRSLEESVRGRGRGVR